MLKLIFRFLFFLTNKLLKYIKSIAVGSYRFSVIFFFGTILNTKIKLIIFLSGRIKAAKITMEMVKVFTWLCHKFVRQFYLLYFTHTISENLSWNRLFNINTISKPGKQKDILIFKVSYFSMPDLNINRGNCLYNQLF